jgi:hypothetical protein
MRIDAHCTARDEHTRPYAFGDWMLGTVVENRFMRIVVVPVSRELAHTKGKRRYNTPRYRE